MNADGNGLVYQGSLVYKKQGNDLMLESVAFNGGRLVTTVIQGRKFYVPNYYLTDHLGSVRVVVDVTGKVLERNDFYPFGMRWAVSSSRLSANRHRYNGKEEQGFLGLPYTDYGARQYNPRTGRWFNPDQLLEKYFSMSPYGFCGNNPVRFEDVDGRDWKDKVMGRLIGVVTNIVPGTTGMRNSYTPNDPSDYNNALAQTDALAMISGQTMADGGEATAVVGTAVAGASVVVTATTAGTSVLVTGPGVLVGGGLTIGGGALKIAGEVMMMNAANNSSKGYNYGEKPKSKNYEKKKARELGRKQGENHTASEKYAKDKAKELERVHGKDARRQAHDAKDKIGRDRTKAEIDEDYEIK